jgi:hypothetical protein
MNGATIQERTYAGYAKAASFIGQTCSLYRAASASNPTASGNLVTTLPASFNAEDMTYSKPRGYAKATWYCLIDGTQTAVGDYLIGPAGTFFIAAMQPLLPILAVKCERTVTVLRPQIQTGVGAQGYGGNTAANETAVMTGWPCSILQGTKGEKAEVNLPGDVRAPWWVMLLPYFSGVDLQFNDIVTDDLGRRYVISSPELTGLGWRCTLMTAVP